MGKAWDAFVPGPATWAEGLRVLKPGGHMAAFAGSRTYDLMAVAIRFAGFHLRDQLMWLYGSGFPKSHDVSKAIDKQRDHAADLARRSVILTVTTWVSEARDAAGVTNRQIDEAFGTNGMAGHWTSSKSQPSVPTADQWPRLLSLLGVDIPPPEVCASVDEWLRIKGQPAPTWSLREVTGQHDKPAMGQTWNESYGRPANPIARERRDKPATELAAAWDGWGTALKPAHEPIVLARAPFKGTVAANVLAHGTAALNIDATRCAAREKPQVKGHVATFPGQPVDIAGGHVLPDERWPANVLHDGSLEVLGAFPPGAAREATRFFYAAKASKEDREFGLTDALTLTGEEIKGRRAGSAGSAGSAGTLTAHSGIKNTSRANVHPTVKPIDLMRWLCRLVTPAGGVVLDPFMGSGSTGIAAIREGFGFIGCEMDPDYFDLARRRVEAAVRDAEATPDLVRDIDRAVAKIRAEQMSLALA